MLSAEDRERIRSEEIYRDEVRRELAANADPAPTGGRKFLQDTWTVLNSQVGGWLLSTVLLGSAAWFYSEWLLPRYEEQAEIRALLAELDFRLDIATHVQDRDRLMEQLRGYPALKSDYEGRPVAALLSNLASLTEEDAALRPHIVYFVEHPGAAPDDLADELDKLRSDLNTVRQAAGLPARSKSAAR